MEHTVKLLQPDILNTPIAEAVIDIPVNIDQFKKDLIGAHAVMQNFIVVVEPVGKEHGSKI